MTYELKMESRRILIKHVASLGPSKADGDPFGGKRIFKDVFFERNPNTVVKIYVSSCFRGK